MLIADSIKTTASKVVAGKLKVAVAKHAPLVLKLDTARLVVRNISDTALTAFSKSEDFDYREERDTESWWDNFWAWVQHFFTRDPTTHSSQPSAFTYIFAALILGLIIFAIVRMAGKNGVNVLGGASMSITDMGALAEDIHQISFEDELQKALAAGNYRLAVRLQYLRMLKQLNDAGLIKWKIEKTNNAYYRELENSQLQRLFGTLTYQFEYAWYGNFGVDAHSYKNISNLFGHVTDQVK